MGKKVFIAEKPSVAKQFASTLANQMHIRFTQKDGFLESDDMLVTWCVGHLVTMSYPEVYDESWKKWQLDPLPFLPDSFRYEVIPQTKKQFDIVKGILTRDDVESIYVCTDSGREGEYIYRLVDQMAGNPHKEKKRVWIDSQTEEEIMRGIREAKDISAYDKLSDAAYLRAIEDYLMGINFSRALTLKYRYTLQRFLEQDKVTISVGRVMTCVLGMVVKRELEIRNFEKTPFYRVQAALKIADSPVTADWKAVEGSAYFNSPLLYKDNGFLKKEDADKLIADLSEPKPIGLTLKKSEKKKEVKKPPLFYNLAELQNDCSRLLKISPDETLAIAQELYEKKMTTYPRTDARVLSTAVAKEIDKNIRPLAEYPGMAPFIRYIMEKKTYEGLAKTKYVNDKQITDHYAIIPTGAEVSKAASLSPLSAKVYEMILRRFVAVFCPDAEFLKVSLVMKRETESFFANFKVMTEPGYTKVFADTFFKKSAEGDKAEKQSEESGDDKEKEILCDENFINLLSSLKKGAIIDADGFSVKEGETSPPKRYSSGNMILAMENAGQLIEDEQLREQIKSSGIGTAATRAGILEKLVRIGYLNLNKKTQIYTPTQLGEGIYYVVGYSMPMMLAPNMTASWEKGLSLVEEGEITSDEYMGKLSDFVVKRVQQVKQTSNEAQIRVMLQRAAPFYKKTTRRKKSKKEG
ncbi:MAG: type IA DNA topoisomerase [Lachnospiraceae bacterium]|nr:type IA DNA topoisomerase [Lachnospiraceae bacterium]